MEKRCHGTADRPWLERCFHKLLLAFTNWVNKCERRLKSAARGGRKVQRWGWVWNLLRQVICSKDRSVRPSVPLVVAVSGHL